MCRSDVFGVFISVIYLRGALSVSVIFPITVWIFLSIFAYTIDARLKTVVFPTHVECSTKWILSNYLDFFVSFLELCSKSCFPISGSPSIIWNSFITSPRKPLCDYWCGHMYPNSYLNDWKSISFHLQSLHLLVILILIPLKQSGYVFNHHSSYN